MFIYYAHFMSKEASQINEEGRSRLNISPVRAGMAYNNLILLNI